MPIGGPLKDASTASPGPPPTEPKQLVDSPAAIAGAIQTFTRFIGEAPCGGGRQSPRSLQVASKRHTSRGSPLLGARSKLTIRK
jgi:hypothetical protein